MAGQENQGSTAKYASATKYDTCEELQIMCRHDDAGKWFARIRTKDFRDRVQDLKFDPDAPSSHKAG